MLFKNYLYGWPLNLLICVDSSTITDTTTATATAMPQHSRLGRASKIKDAGLLIFSLEKCAKFLLLNTKQERQALIYDFGNFFGVLYVLWHFDNRPSTDELHQFKWHMTYDMSYVTCDMWTGFVDYGKTLWPGLSAIYTPLLWLRYHKTQTQNC